MRIFVGIGVWTWALILSSIAFGLLQGSGGMRDFFVALAIGWAPVAAMAWRWEIEMRSEGVTEDTCATLAGVDADSRFFHRESGTALALNTRARTVTVSDEGFIRTYSFDDICGWEGRAPKKADYGEGGIPAAVAWSGIVMLVRTGPRRSWPISMREKETREKWFGMLTEAIAEDEAQRAVYRAANGSR